MNAERAHLQAARISQAQGKAIAVVEIDRDDTREITTMLESDTVYDEFIAFAGEVIAVYRDGERFDD